MVRKIEGHEAGIAVIAISPCDTYFLSGALDHKIRKFDIETGELIQTYIGHTSFVNTLVYSKCGKYLMSGSDDHILNIWNLEANSII